MVLEGQIEVRGKGKCPYPKMITPYVNKRKILVT
jgi:hypothetical protein